MLTLLLGLFGCNNSKSQSNKIPMEKIEEMFAQAKANGVNTDNTMLWGYFFTSENKVDFMKVANELKSKNFDFVEIYQDVNKTYWLHVERKEIHTEKSLYALDDELYAVADKYNVTYDGFDVGNVDKDKAIERDTYAVPEEFNTLSSEKDNYPYLLIGNTAFDRFPHKEEFCYFIKVTAPYKNDKQNMLPIDGELEDLDKFEHFVEDNLIKNKIKNYYVFRDTHKGIRNFYMVTNDKNAATKVLNLIKNSREQRSFDFEILTDKNWVLYKDFKEKMPNK
jgi:hypothetical protein